MKSAAVLVAFAAGASAQVAATAQDAAMWSAWKSANQKNYNGLDEDAKIATFIANARFVEEYNAAHTTHKVSLNKFADLTNAEFKAIYTGLNHPRPAHNANTPFRFAHVAAAPTVDWRGTAVTPVKDQGQCGSCWAFSATGSIEGAWYLATGDLVSVAEQQLVDCDKVDAGCSGGLMDNGFDWVIQNGGIVAESAYPYTAKDGVCASAGLTNVVTISSHESVPSMDEAALKQAVTMRPVSVAAQADELAFQLYSGGVFDGECGTALDHGMLAVGYGFDDASGLEYWIIKNSWGGSWGDNGYINMAFGKNSGACQCGICIEASYAVSDGTPATTDTTTSGPVASPPPAGGLISCDAAETAQCPVGETCCCILTSGSTCLDFGCCPYPDAICCDDYSSCCPGGYTCDVVDSTCLLSATESMPMLKRHAAIKGPGAKKAVIPGFIKA